jgi:threonine/homoserine/homoserine lactone efflux protein
MITVEFLITSLIVVLIPGTGVVFTVSTGLLRGRRASCFAAFGCTAGIVPHLLATVLGLAALMHTSAVAFQMLKYAGVVYLLYLAYATWRDKSAFAVEGVPSGSTAMGLIVKAILLNILNPKLTIFFLAFLPQFVDPERGAPWLQILALGLLFATLGFLSDGVWALVAGTLGDRLRRSRRFPAAQRYISGSVFVGLGAVAALTAPVKQT